MTWGRVLHREWGQYGGGNYTGADNMEEGTTWGGDQTERGKRGLEKGICYKMQ